jgi:hypothetical protein
MASRPVDAQAGRLRREVTGDHDFVCGGETEVWREWGQTAEGQEHWIVETGTPA